MKLVRSLFALVAAALTLVSTATAEVPDTLKYSIPAPPVGVQSGAQLGHGIAMEGNYVVVGSEWNDIGGTDSGVVKVFDSTSGALLFLIPNPAPAVGDQFGHWVAISGTRVAVGAYRDDTGANDAGSAYVYDLSSGTPTVPVATLNNPSPADNDGFGFRVAIHGTRVVVGALLDDASGVDAGIAYMYDLASATPTVPALTLNSPLPVVDGYFGSSVAISDNHIIVGARGSDTGANDTGSAYVYDLSSSTPTVPVATLNNPSPETSDQFGFSVAISSSGVVVGARLDNTGANDAGSAYVYDLSGGTPTVPVAILNNPSPAADDQFGRVVAIFGTRVVVGAFADDTGGPNAGSAYVYDLSSGTPTVPIATLNNPGPAADDQFGYSVAISATRVVVGAWLDDTGATDAGSAYVYDMSSITPTVPVATLNNPSPAADDQFGFSVAVSGNLMVVGAFFDDTGATDAGSAYVYDLSSSTPTVPMATLHNPTPAASDVFGYSVAISGTRVVVGAYNDNTGASDAGSAYVYDLSSGTPTVPVATLNNPIPAASDQFGYEVAISGTRVVVGANRDDTGASDAGSAYVYDLSSGTPTVPVATLNNPTPATSDLFGTSVAVSGTRVVVGAYKDDTGATDAGSAYVYDLSSGTPTVPVATLNNPTPGGDDGFGASVAISGTRVVVGAIFDDTGVTDAGIAYVYDVGSGTPTVPVATFNNPSMAVSDRFGYSVAISGTQVVVGAYNGDTGAVDAGSAYVYDLSSGTPTVPVATLNNPDPAGSDRFGYSVSIDGATVAVGVPLDDTVASDKGYAYVFGPADTTTLPPTLIAPADNTRTKSPISVSFTLPEAALPGSLKLQFGATSLTLAASQETTGAHSFTFDPANPGASPEIASVTNGPLADGTYAVTLLYQDALGNPAASDVNSNIQLDRVTQPPILTSPANMTSVTNSLTIGYILPEPVAFHGRTIRIRIASTNNASVFYELVPIEAFSTAGPHSHTFDPASPSTNPDFFSATPIPPGLYNVTVEYQDDLLNPPATSTPVTDLEIIGVASEPSFTSLYAKGGAVPGAGTDARIQAGATWLGFGPPAINDNAQVAYIGKWKAPAVTGASPAPAQSGTGIFVDDTLVVKVGEAVPGIAGSNFKALKDPVIDNLGRMAFIASITGATPATDTVVVSNGFDGDLHVLAREGSAAPGTTGLFKAFSSVSIQSAGTGIVASGSVPDPTGSGTLFTASLVLGGGVVAANDTGAWWQPAGEELVSKVVREGDAFGTETIKSFVILKGLGGSPGHGRGLASGSSAVLQATLTLGTASKQAQLLATPAGLTEITRTGNTLGSTTLPAATWSKMNLPSTGSEGANLSVLGMLSGTGVTPATAKAILQSADSGTTWEPAAQSGSVAPDIDGTAAFSAFKDPVNSATCADLAFIGTVKGGTVTTTTNDGIWFLPHSGPLALVAREGAQPPSAPLGATWKSFSSLALPGNDHGPIFTAMLTAGAGGITTANDSALYGATSTGTLHELIREGQPLTGKTVKAFTVLKAAAGSAGATRSFNNHGQVVALVTFTDTTTAIVRVDVP